MSSGVAILAKTSQALWKRSKLAKKFEGSGRIKITNASADNVVDVRGQHK